MKKKAMISQPMRGKTEEQIHSERAAVVLMLENRGYEVVNTVFTSFISAGASPLQCLSKSIGAIAEVDFVLFMSGWEAARGCWIEMMCCVGYGVPFEVANR